jgi:DnaA family protein
LIAEPFRRSMRLMDQLLLPFTARPRYSFETLVTHDGIREPLETIRSVYGTRKLPLPSLFLHGTPGTGKTHLLHALATFLEDVFEEEGLCVEPVSAADQDSVVADLERLLSEGTGISKLCGVIVDDVHEAQGPVAAHLWSLSNKLTRSGAALMMASRKPPEETFPTDPHLTSRITSGLVLHLEPPDDTTRIRIIDKMARDRSIRVAPDVSHYLLTRKSRNVSDLNKLLDVLDQASLRFKRRITVPFIKFLEKTHDL